MGRHRRDLGPEPESLRPATVEELAAQERAEKPDRERGGHKRPILVALSTSALLVAGAGAFALAREDQPAVIIEPYGAAAPFGVGYKDGFGEHTPKPSLPATPKKSKTSVPNTSPPVLRSSPTVAGSVSSPGTLLGGTPASSPSQEDGAIATLTAVHWEMTFQNQYWVYIWVNNSGKTSANWQVDVKLPKGATITGAYAVNRVSKGDGAWRLTPTRGTLGPGLTYLFAIEGVSPTQFQLHSCTVNGVTCDPF
ncbi:hypothetical protein [Catelliglobosispora koreensis]|uniref:hypothetical protein n=1 Tax=Catelliglobosispora koreensis TaxID=129052 RepID=UPI000369E832|nr:hypothetical protein [Catelliglobosispora koreensis]